MSPEDIATLAIFHIDLCSELSEHVSRGRYMCAVDNVARLFTPEEIKRATDCLCNVVDLVLARDAGRKNN